MDIAGKIVLLIGASAGSYATAGFALSIVDERKDSAGITSDTSQILPSSNQTMYSL